MAEIIRKLIRKRNVVSLWKGLFRRFLKVFEKQPKNVDLRISIEIGTG